MPPLALCRAAPVALPAGLLPRRGARCGRRFFRRFIGAREHGRMIPKSRTMQLLLLAVVFAAEEIVRTRQWEKWSS
jgi:hypothetical protein